MTRHTKHNAWPMAHICRPVARFLATVLVLAITLAATAGCETTPKYGRSTRMTVDDLNTISAAMTQSLAQSDAIMNRTPTSPLWLISIDRVTNLSSDLMSESERWYVIQKIRSSLPIRAFSKQKNIRFLISAERLNAIRNDPNLDLNPTETRPANRKPTHQMTATFRSITRAQAIQRTELYYCEFELFNFQESTPVWIDKFEYKRGASGHIWD
jgi:hypothetical protein